MVNIKVFVFNPFAENCYLIWDDTKEAVVADPGCMGKEEVKELMDYVAKEGLKIVKILLTHGHFDHIYGVVEVAKATGAKVYMSAAEEQLLRTGNHDISSRYGLPDAPREFEYIPVKEGDSIGFGNHSFGVIETPGHTMGGVCYHCQEEKLLLSGDTLFSGTIGRTDTPWSDYDKLIVGIMEKVMILDTDTDVLPGHGPTTNIGHERTHNPFLQPFNEPEGDIDNEDSHYIQGI